MTASLTQLRLETLDLLYLHNAAEVQLKSLGREGFMKVGLQLVLVCWSQRLNLVIAVMPELEGRLAYAENL